MGVLSFQNKPEGETLLRLHPVSLIIRRWDFSSHTNRDELRGKQIWGRMAQTGKQTGEEEIAALSAKIDLFLFLIQRFCYSLKKMYHILWGGRITTKHWFYSQGISYSWNQLKHPTPGIVNNAVVEMQTLGSWWDKWKDQNLSQKSEWVECNRTGAETRRNTPGCTWTTLTPTFQKTKPSPSSPHLNYTHTTHILSIAKSDSKINAYPNMVKSSSQSFYKARLVFFFEPW